MSAVYSRSTVAPKNYNAFRKDHAHVKEMQIKIDQIVKNHRQLQAEFRALRSLYIKQLNQFKITTKSLEVYMKYPPRRY